MEWPHCSFLRHLITLASVLKLEQSIEDGGQVGRIERILAHSHLHNFFCILNSRFDGVLIFLVSVDYTKRLEVEDVGKSISDQLGTLAGVLMRYRWSWITWSKNGVRGGANANNGGRPFNDTNSTILIAIYETIGVTSGENRCLSSYQTQVTYSECGRGNSQRRES